MLTILVSVSTPLLAEITNTKQVTFISREQLQDKSVLALKQIDVCESIIDTFGQFLANVTSKLSEKKKTEISFQLQSLRKQMGIIKDAYAIHIDAHQLVGLINLTNEVARVLTAAVNSGLEVIPEFDEKVLVNKTTETISLEEIDKLLKRNEKRLQKLTELSEKVGLTNLNRMYRSMRKVYKKYYVWPIIERALVYTAFINWAVYITPGNVFEDMTKKEKGPWRKWFGKWGKEKQASLGKTGFLKTENSSKEHYLSEMDTSNAAEIVITNEYKQGDKTIVEKKTYIDPQKITFKPARPYRPDNVGIREPKYGDHVSIEDTIKEYASEYATYKWPEQSKREYDAYEKETLAIYKDNLAKFEEGSFPKHINLDKENKIPASGGGVLNDAFDCFQGFIDMDWKTALVQVPIGKWFYSYLSEDYKVVSAQCSKITQRIDDMLFGTTKKRTYESLTMPDERFDNIVGRDEVKAELMKVVEYICSPDKFDRAGIKVERGYLLAGDPQTGKTYMAKALTGEINEALRKMGRNDKMRLFEISTDALISKGIAHYMDLARYHAPCILFLDELDLLRLQRDGDSKLLSEFLTSMSGTLSKDEKSHVIILAATNKPENLDFALRQHGRFGKMFWFDKPTFKHRVEFFAKECVKRCMNIDRFDFNELAKQTEGCSFGSLDIVMKKALMLAKLSGSSVTQEHFDKALDSEIKQMIPHGYDVPQEKEQIVAVHNAGKALMSLLLEPQKKLSKVTVLPITQDLQEEHVTQQYNIAGLQSKDQRAIRYGGIFSYNWSDSLNIESQDELKKQCKILLAGNIAQSVYGLPSPAYDKIDKQEAFRLAKQIVFEGLDQKEVAKTIREEKLTEAYRLVEQFEREIAQELDESKTWLIATTQALQERKTLSVGELNELRSNS